MPSSSLVICALREENPASKASSRWSISNAGLRRGPRSRTHYSHGNRIVGGGFLSCWASLSMSRAWEFFGKSNGCASEEEMRIRIGK